MTTRFLKDYDKHRVRHEGSGILSGYLRYPVLWFKITTDKYDCYRDTP